jgi:hypothetical protein
MSMRGTVQRDRAAKCSGFLRESEETRGITVPFCSLCSGCGFERASCAQEKDARTVAEEIREKKNVKNFVRFSAEVSSVDVNQTAMCAVS